MRVRDAWTGAPIEVCDLVGSKTAQALTMYTPSGPNVAPDGVHRYRVRPMVGRLRFDAPGSSSAWTDPVRIDAGSAPTMSLEMQPLGRLVVTVVEADGRPLKEGSLLVVGRELETTIVVKDGVADAAVDAGELLVIVDPDFMPGFVPAEEVVVTHPGRRANVRLEVERRGRRGPLRLPPPGGPEPAPRPPPAGFPRGNAFVAVRLDNR